MLFMKSKTVKVILMIVVMFLFGLMFNQSVYADNGWITTSTSDGMHTNDSLTLAAYLGRTDGERLSITRSRM